MYYILDKNLLIRKWRGGPPFYLFRGSSKRNRLSPDEYELLKKCDGKSEIEPGFLTDKLEICGMIRPCGQGTESLLPGQIIEYDKY